MKKLSFIVAASALALASCTAPHPKMLSFTPASVVIDYTGNDLHAATNMAQQFCSSVEKNAQYVDAKEEGGFFTGTKQIAFFNCIESLKNLHMNNNGGYGSGSGGSGASGGGHGGHVIVMPGYNGNGQAPQVK